MARVMTAAWEQLNISTTDSEDVSALLLSHIAAPGADFRTTIESLQWNSGYEPLDATSYGDNARKSDYGLETGGATLRCYYDDAVSSQMVGNAIEFIDDHPRSKFYIGGTFGRAGVQYRVAMVMIVLDSRSTEDSQRRRIKEYTLQNAGDEGPIEQIVSD